MSNYHANIQTCHQCNLRQPMCLGDCLCTVDRQSIVWHAERNQCPQKYFESGLPAEAKLTIKGKPITSLMFDDEEYQLLKALNGPSEGLGDTVAKLAHAMGANKAAKFWEKITGIGCGCEERRKLLNQWWPYKNG